MITPVHVGIIGCGNISGIYLENSKIFDAIDVVAVADIDPDRAQDRATQYGIPKACSVEELLADPDIDLVVNLTTPDAHGPVALAVLNAGKHVYNEKPLAVTRDEARALLDLAAQKGLRVGCAPDTFLGGGLQTCRKLIDDGWIGEPIGATAFMMSHGPESWHPNPTLFLPARRRSNVRYGSLLPHRPVRVARSGAARDRIGAHFLRRTNDY